MTTPPFGGSRRTSTGVGVSVAVLVYGMSLAVQHAAPSIKAALAMNLGDGLNPTYYLRVIASLAAGLVAALSTRRRTIAEGRLATGVAISVGIGILLACAFP